MHMDLTLGALVEATREVQEEHQALGQDRRHGGGEQGDAVPVEREHMFDKVLTRSDVGKLNRLVVPKQHAERFFPPVAGTGTQLCFEDRAGAPWRFRYSYWGSSQSYVMTKGWSRFVRAARLAMGDTVSFSRGAGGRYFIDYRQCQRRRREISFGKAPAAVPAWPFLDRVQRTSSMTGGKGAIGATDAVDTVPAAGHHDAEAGRSGARSFRLFGFNVECSRDDDAAMEEEEYVDDDN